MPDIYGTTDNDVLAGTAASDSVYGLAGDDTISGEEGGDTLDGGDGADTIFSGAANAPNSWSHSYYYIAPVVPILDRGTEVDTILGGAGLDLIFGGYGDNVDGGADGAVLFYSLRGSSSGVTADFTQLDNGGSMVVGGGTLQNITALYILEGSDYNDVLKGNYTGGTSPDMYGFAGDDILIAGYYTSNLYGGEGNDLLDCDVFGYGGYFYGGSGNDEIFLHGRTGAAFGGSGNDIIHGAPQAYGGQGDDILLAESWAAIFGYFGEDGNDQMVGGDSNDSLDGGSGDDILRGNGGNDTLDGGAGENDTASYESASGGVYVDLLISGAQSTGAAGNDTLISIENLIGGSGADVLSGTSGANVLDGRSGISTLNGREGNDRLILGSGAAGSKIIGGANYDTLVITSTVGSLATLSGIEALEFQGGAGLTLAGSQMINGLASTPALSGAGTLTVNMDATGHFISKLFTFAGGSVSLVVNGTGGDDIFKLGNAAHTVNAGDGSDQVKGGNAADTINGGNGVDKINGAGGADIMTGGGGNDVFKYGNASDSGLGVAADRITDFVIGGDRLNFTQIDANSGIGGDQAFAFVGTGAFTGGGEGSIRYQDSGADLLVQVDVDGNGTVDMEITLQGLAGQTLTGGDFVL